MKTYRLSDYTQFIRRVLALNTPQSVWVSAEIGQANGSRGHTYLSLIEKAEDGERIIAQVDAVIWNSRMGKLQKQHGSSILQLFQTGMAVRLKVAAEFHDRYGFKLVVEDADPVHTLGKLELQRQAVLQRLRAAGMLQLNKEKLLVQVPQKLAIISSETAAGYADFREQLLRNPAHYYYETELFPATMQGENAPLEIGRALKRIEHSRTKFDAVVIIRGGGARMDLVAFDDETLCQRVAAYELPVLVGIGHETDEVLLDYVAHGALKTPTAVAAFLLDRSAQLEGQVMHLAQDIRRESERVVRYEAKLLDQKQQGLEFGVTSRLQAEQLRLNNHAKNLPQLLQQTLKNAGNQLDQAETLLTALRPETTLARGYALVSQAGKIVRSAADLKTDRPIKVRFKDGEVNLQKLEK